MTLTMPWKASSDTPVNGVASKIDDVKRTLSREAERLADITAQYTQDAGAHAADIADDASKQASKVAKNATKKAQAVASDPAADARGLASDVMKAAASLGTALALGSRKTADDLSESAQSVAKDLRNVRITTEPKKTGPDFMPGITLLAGFGAGIALMFFLDPERGRGRRNLLRDKLMSWTRQASATASGTARDLSNRAQGTVIETRKQFSDRSQEVDVTADTQAWSAETGYIDHGSATGFGSSAASASTGSPSSDPSTTDTWGEQPQPSSTTSS
jgi:hypothetical protein